MEGPALWCRLRYSVRFLWLPTLVCWFEYLLFHPNAAPCYCTWTPATQVGYPEFLA